ncbi:glycosyltransferase [Ancylobacter sonchi]|uniref:glycosyltransferase n=1 Tax=Ancylobacter sonchi TaxID=1937790 RepID=UPI0028A75D8F|nr:glycosyltransferase [Ancylobacter sonchi]
MHERAASRFDVAVRLHERQTWDGAAPRAIVALPARDEGDRIEACLAALLAQSSEAAADGRASFGIVLLANNCRDATVSRARQQLAGAGVPHRVHDIRLPPNRANAGFARGLALDLARLWLEHAGDEGALLTTDADTLVKSDWIRRNLEGLSAGCGAVAGRFELDPVEEALLPAHLRRRRRIEAAYEVALLTLSALLDPVPHDPWPNHWTTSGASFALTLSAYRKIGGQPDVKVSEDKALALALACHDIPIRHDPTIVVSTSARLEGRAAGGCATTLKRRCEAHDSPGDEKLEALPAALRRVILRRRFRQAFTTDFRAAEWECRLAMPPGSLQDGTPRHFGEAWRKVEALCPLLARRPLRPVEMERHLLAAQRMLAGLERRSAPAQEIEPIVVSPLLTEEAQRPRYFRDKAFSRFVTGKRIIRFPDPMDQLDVAARSEGAHDAFGEP